MIEMPKHPIEIACRYCGAPAGEKCTSKPKATSQYVQVLNYSHRPRWSDFNRMRSEIAALDDWNNRYGEKPA